MPHSQFSKGDQVEVVEDPGQRSAGPYFPATVLHSPASNKSLIFVEYQSVLDTEESCSGTRKRLRKFVDLENVRPIPPLELNQPFKLGDIVDAYRDNCWSRGIIMDILENSKYLVLFHGDGEEIACEQCNLRLHTDWDNRFSVPPLKKQEEKYSSRIEVEPRKIRFKTTSGRKKLVANFTNGMMVELQKKSSGIEVKRRNMRFKTTAGRKKLVANFRNGMMVEVTSDMEGYEGSWYVATIVDLVGIDRFLVEYRDLVADDEIQPLREEADACHIRPFPPPVPSIVHYKTLQKVDAWHNDGWWEGEISKVKGDSKYVVFFKPTKEWIVFEHSNLRPHQDWKDGKWSMAQEESSSECVDGVNLKMEDIKLKFSKGTAVEVRSDEEGYKGSWYTAKIVEILENDNVLVEYQTLKTDDETEFLKEETDASDIRPCPPVVQHVYPYVLGESVDAWYNDGWWVGCIYKTLRHSKYTVFFATSNELLEFEHCELRPHLEWIGGKWIAALKA